MNETSVKIRRKFDKAFKREAVGNWLASGKSAETVARELGLRANRLYARKKDFAPTTAGPVAKSGSLADLQSQLAAAQGEIRHLREQRDILKKTLGILSEPSRNAMNGSTP